MRQYDPTCMTPEEISKAMTGADGFDAPAGNTTRSATAQFMKRQYLSDTEQGMARYHRENQMTPTEAALAAYVQALEPQEDPLRHLPADYFDESWMTYAEVNRMIDEEQRDLARQLAPKKKSKASITDLMAPNGKEY